MEPSAACADSSLLCAGGPGSVSPHSYSGEITKSIERTSFRRHDPHPRIDHRSSKSKLTSALVGLRRTRNVQRVNFLPNPFNSKNESEASLAWASIKSGRGVVAVNQDYVTSHNLPESFKMPGDDSKHIYILEAYHAIHCVASSLPFKMKPVTNMHQRMLRIHYVSLATGTPPPWKWSYPHDLHCFDALRQYIMCNPDDTLLRSTGHRDSGHGQHKKCQDWDALREWAEEHSAGYTDGWDMVEGFDNHLMWGSNYGGDGLVW